MLDWWKVGEVQSTKIIRGEGAKYRHYSKKVQSTNMTREESTDIIREEWAFELWVTYQADEKRDCAQDAQEGIEGRQRTAANGKRDSS